MHIHRVLELFAERLDLDAFLQQLALEVVHLARAGRDRYEGPWGTTKTGTKIHEIAVYVCGGSVAEEQGREMK